MRAKVYPHVNRTRTRTRTPHPHRETAPAQMSPHKFSPQTRTWEFFFFYWTKLGTVFIHMMKIHLPHMYMMFADAGILVQSTNALAMDLKTKKVSECSFWRLQIILVELYNHYCPWNKKGEEISYKIRVKERMTRDAPRPKSEKKKKVKKLERTQRVRSEKLERLAYDPKSWKFGGIVE